jgi:hypothetical protein
MVSEVTTVTAVARPNPRVRAARFGRNPSRSMASSTTCRVCRLTFGESLTTRETV